MKSSTAFATAARFCTIGESAFGAQFAPAAWWDPLQGSRVDELDTPLYRRKARGVPVYYTVVNVGDRAPEVWRVVKTRWDWSAVPEAG